MAGERAVTAAVLIIGNEILSGRTQDVNLSFLAKELGELGIRVREARVVPDVEEEIVAAVNHCRARYDLVFTTGGIGCGALSAGAVGPDSINVGAGCTGTTVRTGGGAAGAEAI